MPLPVDSLLDIQLRERARVVTVTITELTHESSLQFQQQLDAAVAEAPASSLIVDRKSVVFMPIQALDILVSITRKLQQTTDAVFWSAFSPMYSTSLR